MQIGVKQMAKDLISSYSQKSPSAWSSCFRSVLIVGKNDIPSVFNKCIISSYRNITYNKANYFGLYTFKFISVSTSTQTE